MSKKKNKVSFRLVDVTTEQFALFKENHDKEDIEFDIKFNAYVKVSSEERIIGLFTRYSFDQILGPVIFLECACHFKIEEEAWKKKIQDSIITIKKELLTHFLVLTVGTSRGVLHVKKPKWLRDIMLPTIDVTSVFLEDLSFDLSAEEEE